MKIKLIVYIIIIAPIFCFSQYPEMNLFYTKSYYNPAHIGIYDKTTFGLNFSNQDIKAEGNQFRHFFVYNILPDLAEGTFQIGTQYMSFNNNEYKKDEYSFLSNYKMELGSGQLGITFELVLGSFLLKEKDKRKLYFNVHEGFFYKTEKYSAGLGIRNINTLDIRIETDTFEIDREFYLSLGSKHKILDNGSVDYVDKYLFNSISIYTDAYSLGYLLNSTFYFKYFGLGGTFKHDLYNNNLFAINVGFKLDEKAELQFGTYILNNNDFVDYFGNKFELSLIYMLK